MKRSGPLARNTPLERFSRLERTPIERSAGVRRRQARQAKFSAAVRARSGGMCQGCPSVHPGSQAHHVLPRGRGGSDDPDNGLWCCAEGHRWIHEHPEIAERLGLLRRSGGE